ncbi:helix-turn-helix domain-containing protein [Pelovirga terrestris]|nr:helix-turn-helix domain-containing protein [Pelovirga terrestris]
MPTSKDIPLSVAATKSHSTTLNLLMHIKRGLLPATEEQGQWFINETDLEAFIADNRKAEPGELGIHSGCGKGCGSCAEE